MRSAAPRESSISDDPRRGDTDARIEADPLVGLIRICIAVIAGVLLGLLYTIHALDTIDKAAIAGPWRGATHDGTAEIDPYALAANDRAGLLPLGIAEGLTFVARTDDTGATFSSACDYVVTGPMPPARTWTISLLDHEGFPVAGPAQRYGFTSAEVLREVGEPVTIHIAPKARSGNWLPSGGARDYSLMLRLYDTGLSTVGTVVDARTMPRIVKGDCR